MKDSLRFAAVFDDELDQVRKRRELMRERPANRKLRVKCNLTLPPVSQWADESRVGRARKAAQDLESPHSDDDDTLKTWQEYESALRESASQDGLVGLALSGGGIRSATFNLGALQALAELKVLPAVDYLSTVSGGGYIGAWLAAWVKREGSLETVRQQLCPNRKDQATGRVPATAKAGEICDEEPEAIQHLRAYSNYLTPHLGFLSADTWVLAAIYIRNLLLNLCILVPAILIVMAVARMTVGFFRGALEGPWLFAIGLVSLGALVGAVSVVLAALSHLLPGHIPQEPTWKLRWKFSRQVPILLAGAALFSGAVLAQDRIALWAQEAPGLIFVVCSVVASALFVVAALIHLSRQPPPSRANAHERRSEDLWTIIVGLITGIFCGSLFALLIHFVAAVPPYCFATMRTAGAGIQPGPTAELVAVQAVFVTQVNENLRVLKILSIATVGPPAVLAIFALSTMVWVGLLGRTMKESFREWWASLAGWIAMTATGWLMLFGFVLFAPYLVGWAIEERSRLWVSAVAIVGWLGSTVIGVLGGRSAKTGAGKENTVFKWATLIAPYVFLAGLLVLLATVVQTAVGGFPASRADYLGHILTPREWHSELATTICKWLGINSAKWPSWPMLCALLVLAVGCLSLCALSSRCININLFSLRSMYGNRLVRCYLGASRPKYENRTERGRGAPINSGAPRRQPNEITGFDPSDDFPLAHLEVGPPPNLTDLSENQPTEPPRSYKGPVLLVNTALNLVQGDELAWQERKAESFVLSARYCGSASTGYQKTVDFANRTANITLGDAVSTSGAAVSPNMGYHSSPAVTALLTVFNARLGAWVGNPRRMEWWRRGSPFFAMRPLLKECFGRTNAHSKYIYLSDGGHFDNLGIYELIRRRCRFIIAIDAGADASFDCGDLAAVIRKCRVDFGIRVDIDTEALRRRQDGSNGAHCAIGVIHYDDVDRNALPGILVYLKPTLTGDEPTDIQEYARRHPRFPHQSTIDQFYNESQFESYRGLGYHATIRALGDAICGGQQSVGRFFDSLQRRWLAPPPEMERHFVESVKGYCDQQKRWAAREDWGMARSVYGDLRSGRHDRNLHRAANMLQVMENAWLTMHLNSHADHPMNRGWLTAFHRWASARPVRRAWPILRGEFSYDFVRFCERELYLPKPGIEIQLVPRKQSRQILVPGLMEALALMDREFVAEWSARSDRDFSPMQWAATLDNPNAHGLHIAWLTAPDCEPIPIGFIRSMRRWGPGPRKFTIITPWQRPVFRSQGLGARAMRRVVKTMKRHGAIWALLPKKLENDPPERMRESLWISFFANLGFRRVDPISPRTVGDPQGHIAFDVRQSLGLSGRVRDRQWITLVRF